MSQTPDREPNGGPLNPEDLAELKCWAEDTAVEQNWQYTDRLWIRGTVLKLIEEFERLEGQVDDFADEMRVQSELDDMARED